jgi:hypothetical protein
VRVPVPEEYESPSATYLVAHAGATKTAQASSAQANAARRLIFIWLSSRES